MTQPSLDQRDDLDDDTPITPAGVLGLIVIVLALGILTFMCLVVFLYDAPAAKDILSVTLPALLVPFSFLVGIMAARATK